MKERKLNARISKKHLQDKKLKIIPRETVVLYGFVTWVTINFRYVIGKNKISNLKSLLLQVPANCILTIINATLFLSKH